ncbi:24316_t:CDS:2 [Dentiscutata erythropus]|uniref:24316_t:CDS:1 n=1 Tax=Dentiscutata erythropus TaxID=1348616 RepID=A0A9N9NVX7_9GLOM|nr:24316_t:CDS:2 [Dentiscutata erythropus]
MSISNEELDLTNMLTIFNEEEENRVDVDEELLRLMEESLYKVLDYYWDALLDCFLIAILLDPRCKSMKKLDSWEHNKAIDLLREKYDLLSIRNKTPLCIENRDQLASTKHDLLLR